MVLAIIALLALNLRQCSTSRNAKAALEAATADAVFWRDKHNRSNAEILVLQTDLSLYKQTNKELIDSLKKEGIKPRDTKRVVTITEHTTDTLYVNKPRFSSPWLDYEWIDDSSLRLTVRDSLALITHDKRYGFLGLKKKYVTRAISYNPHTILTGITSTEIVPKQKIGLGFYAGYGATLSGGAIRLGPQIGFGIHIRL